MPKHKSIVHLAKRFATGKGGGCEAYLFEFQEQGAPESRTLKIAAAKLDEAVKYLRGHEPDFHVKSVHNLGVIIMVSGTPVD